MRFSFRCNRSKWRLLFEHTKRNPLSEKKYNKQTQRVAYCDKSVALKIGFELCVSICMSVCPLCLFDWSARIKTATTYFLFESKRESKIKDQEMIRNMMCVALS